MEKASFSSCFFWSFRQSFWHLHLQLQRWNQENIYIFLWCFRLPLDSQEIPCSAISTLPSATAMFIGFFWSCYHRLSLHPWLKALSTCDFQSPKVLLWPMGVGGIRPRSQGGKCRGLVNFVEIHEGGRDGIFPCRVGTSLCASWFLNMKPCVSGYNLITCFLKSMWKSLQAVPWGSWNHHLILLELICFKTSRSCFSQVVAFGTTSDTARHLAVYF